MLSPNMATITTPFPHKPTHRENDVVLSLGFAMRMKIFNSRFSKEIVTVYGQIRGLCGSIKLTRCHSSAG